MPETVAAPRITARFIREQRLRGETSRKFMFDGVEGHTHGVVVSGAHTAGPWWSVYLMAYTPDGRALCGMSFTPIGVVPGGLGRDERITSLALNELIGRPDFHDVATCGVCSG